jgi:hypothetical protein
VAVRQNLLYKQTCKIIVLLADTKYYKGLDGDKYLQNIDLFSKINNAISLVLLSLTYSGIN